MVPTPAQYLLRFDDLCPTVSKHRWQRLLPLIEEFGLRPILAVIPDNRDTDLQHSAPDPDFWVQIRTMEAAGATVGLHGYQHICKSRGHSLLGLHNRTEFAGASLEVQREWMHKGLQILRGHGLSPKLWVAPRHGFDLNTLVALRKEGIKVLSDGLARVPFTRGGLTWIPQQLWSPVDKPKGLWTICVHANTAHIPLVTGLRAFLSEHTDQFTSVERVLAEFPTCELSVTERIYEAIALWRIRVANARKRARRRSRMH